MRTKTLAGGGFLYVRISGRDWFQVTKSGSWLWEWAQDGVKMQVFGTEAVRVLGSYRAGAILLMGTDVTEAEDGSKARMYLSPQCMWRSVQEMSLIDKK